MKSEIPIFFATDDNYIPFLGVAIYSLAKNSSKENNYKIIILNSGLEKSNIDKIKKYEQENIKIEFTNISLKIHKIEEDLSLRLRDYYSTAIYYRMFIPSMFPEYDKALYLDSDIVILDDIAKLYSKNIGNNLVAAITDDVVNGNEHFKRYSKITLGIEPERYFNSGILLMNLKEFRDSDIESKFLHILTKFNFDTIAPDQDYLNFLCKDRVYYVQKGWDKMPFVDENFDEQNLHLLHFNMFQKPWYYSNVPYEKHFWEYAKKTEFYNKIVKMKENYTDFEREKDEIGSEKLVAYSDQIVDSNITFYKILGDNYFTNEETYDDTFFEFSNGLT